MPDNVNITAGTGTPIATDEVAVNGGTTAHVQYVKLVDGTGNGTNGVPGSADGLYVIPRRDLLEISVTSGGLTTATTAYSAGDQMGTGFTFANAARTSGGYGYITGVSLISAADNIGAIDVVFFDRAVTLAADNAAFAISDADALFFVGYVSLQGAYDIGNNRVAQAMNIALPYKCATTSLYAGLICRGTWTFFGAVTDIQLNIFVERS